MLSPMAFRISAAVSKMRFTLPAGQAAVGAASWTARDWLGLPGLTDGAPADLVVFDEDPVAHPDVLHHPRRVILRGQILA